MARSLSNVEFSQFMQDYGAQVQQMAYPQTRIFDWNGEKVLVFIGPNFIDMGDGQLFQDVYLTDVTNAPQLAAMQSGAYQQAPQSMLDTLPAATLQVITDEAASAGALMNSAGQSAKDLLVATAGAIGETVGAAVAPVAGSLSPILIGALVILGLYLMPKR